MKKKITLLLLFTSICVFSQKKLTKLIHKRTYTTLSSYKKNFGEKITKSDSLNFIIKGKDTLIPLPKDYVKPEGVLVEYEPKDSTFLEIYKDIVYKKHYQQNNSNSKKLRMRLWKPKLKIYFTKSVDRTVKKELKNFANKLSNEIDSLNISFVNNIEKSNYIIYGFNSQNDYKYDNRIKSNNNDYYISWRGSKIYDCKLQINSNSFKTKKELVINSKILFLRSLGNLNFTNQLSSNHYFSNSYSINKQFSKIDLELIKYHYSYGICKGTDLKTFESNHRNAKMNIERTGRPYHFLHIN